MDSMKSNPPAAADPESLAAIAIALGCDRDAELGTLYASINELARRERAVVEENEFIDQNLRALRAARLETQRVANDIAAMERSGKEELSFVSFGGATGAGADGVDSADDASDAEGGESADDERVATLAADVVRWDAVTAEYTARNAIVRDRLLRLFGHASPSAADVADDRALASAMAAAPYTHAAVAALGARLAATRAEWEPTRRRLAVYHDLPPDRAAAERKLGEAKTSLAELTARLDERYNTFAALWDH